MSEFEKWFKSLNENGRVTYFLGQEGGVSEEAWNHQQAKIDALQKRIDEYEKLTKSIRSEFDLSGGSDQVERQIEILEELRGEHE